MKPVCPKCGESVFDENDICLKCGFVLGAELTKMQEAFRKKHPSPPPTTFEQAVADIFLDCSSLMVRKQRDYGHANITTFGEQGVLIRLHDKIARLINLSKTGKEPNNEAVDDTWMDALNYCAIALMLRRGTFTLPLEEDTRD